MAQKIWSIITVINLLHHQCFSQHGPRSSGQAFVQTDTELLLHMLPGHSGADQLRWEEDVPTPVELEPPLLDFEEQPVGMPRLQQVIIRNADLKNSMHLISITGSSLHFHCSFFLDKRIMPQSNTSFEVIFLPRQEGNVENTLYLHTSMGIYKYHIFGVGIPNPYRVRPFLGAKLPVNSTFSPLIYLHNPHSVPLQVQEVFTTGGGLHLELPTGETEASTDLWEIHPYDTKVIMKASFFSYEENNHTAFIRIKTNKELKGNSIVVPVEVEISNAPGLYSSEELLDFGIVRSCDPPQELHLHLINSGPEPAQVYNISVSPYSDAVHIEFLPGHIKPSVIEKTLVARLFFNASKVSHTSVYRGTIIIKSKESSKPIQIPYQARVLKGSLTYQHSDTFFYDNGAENTTISQLLRLRNTFSESIAIYNATFPPELAKSFYIEWNRRPVVMSSGEESTPLRLSFVRNETRLALQLELLLHTNASVFNIPVYFYDGRLRVTYHRPLAGRGRLDFGTVEFKKAYSLQFTVHNDNPIEVFIQSYKCHMDGHAQLQLLGIEQGNGTYLSRSHNQTQLNLKNELTLKPGHFAVFNLKINTPIFEHTFVGEALFQTDYELMRLQVIFNTAGGILNIIPPVISFYNSFSGKVSVHDVYVRSTFKEPMKFRNIAFQPEDSRFTFTPAETDVTIKTATDTLVGRVFFDPKKHYNSSSYLGIDPVCKAGKLWLQSATLKGNDLADLDRISYTRLWERWGEIQRDNLHRINATLQIDAGHHKGFLHPVQAELIWPSLVNVSHVEFPLTQIHNSSTKVISIQNPSEETVVAQVVPLHLLPDPEDMIYLFSDRFPSQLALLLETYYTTAFVILEMLRNSTYNSHEVNKHRKQFEKQSKVKVHPESLPLVLAPKSKINLHIAFKPQETQSVASLILVRNNMTVLDAVLITGSGGKGDLRFGNKRIGSTQPLLFELTEKHLATCETRLARGKTDNFSVKRTFLAKNTGQLPIFVKNFYINDHECEGFGFRILDCSSFTLKPNDSKKIDIAFSPDFTMSRVQRTLRLETSLDAEVNYTLQASLPTNLLNGCSAALPRPNWEQLLQKTLIVLSVVILFCTLAVSYCDSGRIKTTAATAFLRERVHLLDFRRLTTAGVERVQVLSTTNTELSSCLQELNGDPSAQLPRKTHSDKVVNGTPAVAIRPKKQNMQWSEFVELMQEGALFTWRVCVYPFKLFRYVPRICNKCFSALGRFKSYMRAKEKPRKLEKEYKTSPLKFKGDTTETKKSSGGNSRLLQQQHSSDSEEVNLSNKSYANQKKNLKGEPADKSKAIKDHVPDLLTEAVEMSKTRKKDQKSLPKEEAAEEEKPEQDTDTNRNVTNRKNKKAQRKGNKRLVVVEDNLDTHSQDSTGSGNRKASKEQEDIMDFDKEDSSSITTESSMEPDDKSTSSSADSASDPQAIPIPLVNTSKNAQAREPGHGKKRGNRAEQQLSLTPPGVTKMEGHEADDLAGFVKPRPGKKTKSSGGKNTPPTNDKSGFKEKRPNKKCEASASGTKLPANKQNKGNSRPRGKGDIGDFSPTTSLFNATPRSLVMTGNEIPTRSLSYSGNTPIPLGELPQRNMGHMTRVGDNTSTPEPLMKTSPIVGPKKPRWPMSGHSSPSSEPGLDTIREVASNSNLRPTAEVFHPYGHAPPMPSLTPSSDLLGNLTGPFPTSSPVGTPGWQSRAAPYLDVNQQLLLRQLEEQQLAAEKLKKQLLAQFSGVQPAGPHPNLQDWIGSDPYMMKPSGLAPGHRGSQWESQPTPHPIGTPTEPWTKKPQSGASSWSRMSPTDNWDNSTTRIPNWNPPSDSLLNTDFGSSSRPSGYTQFSGLPNTPLSRSSPPTSAPSLNSDGVASLGSYDPFKSIWSPLATENTTDPNELWRFTPPKPEEEKK